MAGAVHECEVSGRYLILTRKTKPLTNAFKQLIITGNPAARWIYGQTIVADGGVSLL